MCKALHWYFGPLLNMSCSCEKRYQGLITYLYFEVGEVRNVTTILQLHLNFVIYTDRYVIRYLLTLKGAW